MWRRNALLRFTLPPLRTVKRLAAPLLVLSFGMFTPIYDMATGGSHRGALVEPAVHLLRSVR
jgi:hypothetical protein